MAGVCNRNAILSGLIDYYCLVCEDLFQNVEDVHQHVDTPHHNKILQQTYYVNEYTEHRIKKLRKGYFCEYCNEAFTTSSKMRSHVDSETHVYRRNSKQFSSSRSVLNLSWSGNRVLTSQLLIDERPWNGILDDNTCLVCDEEIDSFEDHKKIWSHVLKLAQTKILVGKDELSRQIKDSLYQCLICNTMCPKNDFDKHNTTESHLMNYTKAIQSTPVSTVDNGDVGQSSNNNNDCKEKEGNMIENDTKDEQKSEENNRNHTSDEQAAGVLAEKEQKPSTSKAQDNQTLNRKVKDAIFFAKLNNFTYIENVNTATCEICKVKVPFYLTNMKEHVNGVVHKNKMVECEKKMAAQNHIEKKQKNKGKANISQESMNNEDIEEIKRYTTMICKDFVRMLIKATDPKTGAEEIQINGYIYISMFSLVMVTGVGTRSGPKPMCQLCQKIIPSRNPGFSKHLHSYIKINGVKMNHNDALKKILVVRDLGQEFVREVRPDEFHCGYCNIVIPGWDDLNRHLNNMIHKKMKMEARRKAKLFRDDDDDNGIDEIYFLTELFLNSLNKMG